MDPGRMSARPGFAHEEALMIEYAEATHTFTSPKGNPVQMHYRKNSSDWNTLWSALNEDEYKLAGRSFTGYALDVGAHIGSVSLGLAIDNPGLTVISVEPVPDNVEFLRRNASVNGLSLVILEAAGAGPDDERTTINYRYRGTEAAEHHAFIGDASLIEGTGQPTLEHETRDIACVSIGAILDWNGIDRLSVVKIDCEGCEFRMLTDPAIDRVDLIVGEWHPNGNKTQGMFRALLEATHDVTFSGFEAGPGGFVAVRR